MEKWNDIKLDDFNGPLDLLLHLIKEKDLDLLNISLVDVTEQYLMYIRRFEELDIEIASEYLVMATYLIELKSKMMLPKEEVDIEDGYENGVDNLVNRLIEYHKIKEAVKYFKGRQSEYIDSFSKERTIIKAAKVNEDELPLAENNINLDKFAKIFLKVIEKNKLKSVPVNTITATELSPEEVSEQILVILKKESKNSWSLEELLELQGPTLQMMLALFLSILDLAKNGIISIEQTDNDIWIHKL